MKPYCRRCGFELDSSDAPCKECESEILKLTVPSAKPTCPDCGDPIEPGRTLCDFCMYKHLHSQSYPPSIVPAAEKAMKAAVIESILLSVDNMTQQLGMMRNLLIGMKEADK